MLKFRREYAITVEGYKVLKDVWASMQWFQEEKREETDSKVDLNWHKKSGINYWIFRLFESNFHNFNINKIGGSTIQGDWILYLN